MDYELYVQIEKGGGWQLLDLPDLSVPMNYQINTLAELKDRNGSYSQNISLPRSSHNMQVFGFGLDIETVSDIPYRRHRCQLFCRGMLLSPPGAVLAINALKPTSIDVQILSGTIDFIKVLQDKTMTSDKADGFWRLLDLNSIPTNGGRTTLGNGVRLAYPYATLIRNPLSAKDVGAPDGFMQDVAKIYPHLNFHDTVKWIIEHEGYTFETDLEDTDKREHYVPCIIPKAVDGVDTVDAYGYFRSVGSISNGPVQWTWKKSNISGSITLIDGTGLGNIFFYYAFTYQKITGGIDLYVDTHGDANQTVYVSVGKTTEISDAPEGNIVVEKEFNTTGIDHKVYIDTTLDKGQYLYVNITTGGFVGGAPTSEGQLYLYGEPNIAYIESEEPTPGIYYDLLDSMGFNTRADFFKAFLQTYGLTLDIDPADKVVRAYSMNKIYENKGKAYDWTGTLAVNKDAEISYQVDGYAQQNTIKLVDNEDNSVKTGYTFSIDNQNLEGSKELFTIDFMALKNYETATNNYPIYEITREGSTRTSSYRKPDKTHLIRPNNPRRNYMLRQGSASSQRSLELSRHQVLPGIIPDYYDKLVNGVLDASKKLTAYFALTPADIENIDLFVPVWLEQYGHYFYIAKIINFTVGKLTKVDLIRL